MRCAEQDCLPCGGGDLRRAVGCQGRTRPGVRPRLPSLKITQFLQIEGVKPSVHAGCDQNPQFLHHLCASCSLQQESDSNHGVSWSRHLLTNIQQSMGAALLVGASAVTYNPHYAYYSSQFPSDSHLGAVTQISLFLGIFLLDSFELSLRATLMQKAAAMHRGCGYSVSIEAHLET